MEFYSFDGRCSASRDADYSLQFEDGNVLRVHSTHLKKISPVLKSAFEDGVHDGTLAVVGDNCHIWRLLLNATHPGSFLLFKKHIYSSAQFYSVSTAGSFGVIETNLFLPWMKTELAPLVALARKYNVEGIEYQVDCGMSRMVYKAMDRLPQAFEGQECFQQTVDSAIIGDLTIVDLAVLAAELDLQTSAIACSEHITTACGRPFEDRLQFSAYQRGLPKSQLSSLAGRMLDCKTTGAASLILQHLFTLFTIK